MITQAFDGLTLTTPAMMFPAISLLLLAYTNRYLTLSNRVRSLFDCYQEKPEDLVLLQIASMRSRLSLIRWMQVSGVTSLLLCVVVMFLIFIGLWLAAQITFIVGMLLMMVSLVLSVMELHVSNEALNILLSKIESHKLPPRS
ncbi:MAG: DUF2721 domain-containing protein [Gammaproteobacteria bacterium]|nr:DUF2721 domain-containing protein [Gammaproteobacteria bacterium]